MSTQSTSFTATVAAEKRRSKASTLAVKNLVNGGKKSATPGIVAKPALVVTNVDGNAVPATGSSLLANLLTLRDQGTTYYEKFFVPGRNAMQAIMGEVYAQFHAANSAPTYQQNLKVLREKLKEYGVTIRKSSSDASLFIRMVFKDFDDKQVSIYSRSLSVAFAEGVAPDAFGKYVEDTDGGFYGIVISTGTGKPTKAGAVNDAGKVAFQDVQQTKAVAVINEFQWDGDEERCVLIATRGMDDDSALLKKIGVSEELFFNFLAKYAAEKQALLNEALSSDVGATKAAMKTFESERANNETEISNLQADMRVAEAGGDVAEVNRLREKLKVAMMRRDQTVRTLKQLQGEIEVDSKEKAAA